MRHPDRFSMPFNAQVWKTSLLCYQLLINPTQANVLITLSSIGRGLMLRVLSHALRGNLGISNEQGKDNKKGFALLQL